MTRADLWQCAAHVLPAGPVPAKFPSPPSGRRGGSRPPNAVSSRSGARAAVARDPPVSALVPGGSWLPLPRRALFGEMPECCDGAGYQARECGVAENNRQPAPEAIRAAIKFLVEVFVVDSVREKLIRVGYPVPEFK